MKRVIVTGASGFIGKHFINANKERYNLIPLRVRAEEEIILPEADAILHLSGLAHQKSTTERQAYFDANQKLTQNLFSAAKSIGVNHFIYISSIKVYGPYTGIPFEINSDCKPDNDPYGESKLAAEKDLLQNNSSDIKLSIVRPPLVYGPGVKANMYNLIKMCNTFFPLPLKGVHNKRTVVYISNLVDIIVRIIDSESEGIYCAGDGSDVSTEELVVMIRKYLNRSNNIFPLSGLFLSLLKKIFPDRSQKLFDDLCMNTKASFEDLGFIPAVTTEKGIEETVNWYLDQKQM